MDETRPHGAPPWDPVDPDGPPPPPAGYGPAAPHVGYGPRPPEPGTSGTSDPDPPRQRSRPSSVLIALGVVLGLVVLTGAGLSVYQLGRAVGSALGLTGDPWATEGVGGPGTDGPGPVLDLEVVVDPIELDERLAAGCTELVGADGPEPLEDRSHLDEAAPETPDELYDLRPPHSGRHLAQVLPVQPDPYPSPIDERAAVHNLEHGAVLVLYDADLLDDDEVAALGTWTVERNLGGFLGPVDGAGVGVLVAPAEPGSITSGSAVALRAWGVATDCDGFDEVVADGFLATNYGDRGVAPERSFGPYPDGAVEITPAG